jgi:hypothetical protein
MRRLVALVPVVLAVALLAPGGCGTATKHNAKDFTGVKHDVAQVVDDLASQARKGEASKICDQLLTPALRRTLAARARTSRRGVDCADQLKDSIRDADAFEITVRSIAVTGDSATVRVTTKTSADRDPADTLALVRQRGWRISRLP